MRKFKIVDERKTERAFEYPLSVAARPFAIHDQLSGSDKWCAIPGAYFSSLAKAEEELKRLKKERETNHV